MTEKQITNATLKTLNRNPHIHAWKRLSNGMDNNNGMPDITGYATLILDSGLRFAIRLEIEMKQPGETPRKLQLSRLRKLKNAGCITGWADSVQGATDIVDNGLCELKNRLDLEGGIKQKKPA